MRTVTTAGLFAAILIILSVIPVSAGKLALNDCIELALQNRASIIAARGRENLAKASRRSALGAFLPSVSASYNRYESKRTDGKFSLDGGQEFTQPDQDISGRSYEISAAMWAINVPTWFNYFGARADRAKAHLDIINSEQDLIFSVKTIIVGKGLPLALRL